MLIVSLLHFRPVKGTFFTLFALLLLSALLLFPLPLHLFGLLLHGFQPGGKAGLAHLLGVFLVGLKLREELGLVGSAS